MKMKVLMVFGFVTCMLYSFGTERFCGRFGDNIRLIYIEEF